MTDANEPITFTAEQRQRLIQWLRNFQNKYFSWQQELRSTIDYTAVPQTLFDLLDRLEKLWAAMNSSTPPQIARDHLPLVKSIILFNRREHVGI